MSEELLEKLVGTYLKRATVNAEALPSVCLCTLDNSLHEVNPIPTLGALFLRGGPVQDPVLTPPCCR